MFTCFSLSLFIFSSLWHPVSIFSLWIYSSFSLWLFLSIAPYPSRIGWLFLFRSPCPSRIGFICSQHWLQSFPPHLVYKLWVVRDLGSVRGSVSSVVSSKVICWLSSLCANIHVYSVIIILDPEHNCDLCVSLILHRETQHWCATVGLIYMQILFKFLHVNLDLYTSLKWCYHY